MGQTKAPTAPQQAQITPYHEIFKQGGKTQATRVFDPVTNAFTTNVDLSKEDQQIEDVTRGGLAGLAGQAAAFNPSDANLAKYQGMLADPQKRAVNSAFDKVQGNAILGASGNGMAQSAGMARYLANEVAGKRAQALGDVDREAFLGRGQAMMGDFAPLEQQANFLQALRQGGQTQNNNMSSQVMQGAQLGMGQMTAGANMANQAYQNQLQAHSSKQSNFFAKMFGL